MAGKIDMGHARALLPLDGAHQITSATEIAAKKLSVREAEKLVKAGVKELLVISQDTSAYGLDIKY
eukprot:gene44026-biopygen37424